MSDALHRGPRRRAAVGALVLALAMCSVGAAGASGDSVDWSPGNGVLLPHGIWVAGDVTLATEILEEDASTVSLDDVSLLGRWDVTRRFALFGELRLDDIWEAVEGDGPSTGTGDVTVERLYAELLLTPHVTLRLGKFYTPFGLWNEIRRAPLTWTVERPAITQNVFPQHATGLSLLYQTTWQGWSFDATAYGPAQDQLAFRDDPPNLEEDGLLFGGRTAVGRTVGPVFAALGVNAAGFRSYDRSQWTTVVGPDLAIAVMGHEITAELTFSIPDDDERTIQGLYVQDVIPLTPVVRIVPELYGVLRVEQFQPAQGSSAVGGLVGLFWRPTPMLVLRAGYFFTDRTVGEFEPGFVGSASVLF